MISKLEIELKHDFLFKELVSSFNTEYTTFHNANIYNEEYEAKLEDYLERCKREFSQSYKEGYIAKEEEEKKNKMSLYQIEYYKDVHRRLYNIWEVFKNKLNQGNNVKRDYTTSAELKKRVLTNLSTVNRFKMNQCYKSIDRLKDFYNLLYGAMLNNMIYSFEEILEAINDVLDLSLPIAKVNYIMPVVSNTDNLNCWTSVNAEECQICGVPTFGNLCTVCNNNINETFENLTSVNQCDSVSQNDSLSCVSSRSASVYTENGNKKKCSKCNKFLPLTMFRKNGYINGTNTPKYRGRCKNCDK